MSENLVDNSPEPDLEEIRLVQVNEIEQITNGGSEGPPSVSSRGRVRRPTQRLLQDDFIWEWNSNL